MIDQRTKSICKDKKYPSPVTFEQHQKLMQDCSRSLWKSFIADLKRPK